MSDENEKIRISKSAFQEWLEKLQQESWQLELLISGFALFAIWEARVLVDGFDEYYNLQFGSGLFTNTILSNISWFIGVAWRIFFFNLLIHVIARGMWIGAIGLRYVSSEINYESLDYAPLFDNFLRKRVGDFDDYIEKLERFSSVIFAYTFLLFFIFLSLVLFFAEISLVFFLLGKITDNPQTGGVAAIIIFTLGIIAAIDFITMGGIKKIREKNISRVYFVLYRIVSFLTLSFLYRPLLYNFWDEKYTRRLFLVSLPYILLLTLIPKLESEAFPYFPIYHHGYLQSDMARGLTFGSEFYDDERALVQEQKKGIFRKKTQIKVLSLPSIEMEGNYGWFFLRSYPRDAQYLENKQQITPFKKTGLNIRHWRDEQKDSLLEILALQKIEARTVVLKQKFALSKKIRKGENVIGDIGIKKEEDQYLLNEEYWDTQLDSLDTYWKEKQDDYLKNKLIKLNRTLLNLAEITIDSIPYNDKCDCKFYIHPNIGEKGLRCYFPIKDLPEGPHTLTVSRKRFYGGDNDEETTDVYHIPFYKIKKDNFN